MHVLFRKYFSSALPILVLLGLSFLYWSLPLSMPPLTRGLIPLFLFAVLFWAFEWVPLYATSIMIVVLLCLLSIQERGIEGYEKYLGSFANPVIFLFLGGFVFAKALAKNHLDQWLLEKILKRFGHSSRLLLVVVVFMSAFFSMWISNTAAAAMMIALVRPIFKKEALSFNFKKALAIAVAFGCNVGGMGTPIGTPPNAIVLGILREKAIGVSFIEWMLMAVPLAALILVILIGILFYLYPFPSQTIASPVEKTISLTRKSWVTAAASVGIVLLWLTSSLTHIPEFMTSLIAIVLLVSLRLINFEDLRSVEWEVLLLMWGGLALGVAIGESGVMHMVEQFGFIHHHQFLVIAAFSVVGLVLSFIISNTASANLLLPLVVGISSIDQGLIAITVALSCSLGMAFPVSTPPNAIAFSTGYLKTSDFNKTGIPLGILALVVVLLGFWWVIPKALSLL